MKKISIIIAFATLLGLVSCGMSARTYSDSLALMNNVWDGYKSDERFSAIGGDSGTAARDMPARYTLTDRESREKDLMLPSAFSFAVSDISCIKRDDGNGQLTAAAYYIDNAENIGVTAAAVRSQLMRTGIAEMPEKFVAVAVGDRYLLTAYGNESDINVFLTKSLSGLDGAVILYDESLTPVVSNA
ncbi:MAG: hypothetical protein MJ101_05680 [Clostridia bacterium]|nr:hypothetical protein [Clostridia bacterium]